MKPMKLESIIQPHLLALKPYSSARHEHSGNAEIFLDANENPFNTGNNRYPDPNQLSVKEHISKWRNLDVNQIFLGNGSDEAIDLLIRLFCNPQNDQIIVTQPTYGMYSVSAQIANVEVIHVAMTSDFGLDVNAIQNQYSDRTKLLFLCSPNNPTGNCLNPNHILELINTFPGIVVVDEAYIDFCLDKSMLPLIKEKNNLVLLQTFSKAWGLAGIRLGMALANPEIISWLNKIKAPYNINILTQKAAIEAFENISAQQEWIKKINLYKEQLIESLQNLDCVEMIYPSDANFLLVKMDNARRRYSELKSVGIVVRDRSNVMLCADCLRFTIGTKKENDKLVLELSRLSNI